MIHLLDPDLYRAIDGMSMADLEALALVVSNELGARKIQLQAISKKGFRGWSVSNKRNAEFHGLDLEPEDLDQFDPDSW